MPSKLPAPARTLLLVLAASLLLGCPGEGDDDDSTPLIEPPQGCANFSLAGVTFDFLLHFGELDYPMDELEDLMVSQGWSSIGLPIEGEVIRRETDPDDDDKQILRVQELPPDPLPDDWDPDAFDPNWLEIAAELPPGYDLPAELGEVMTIFFQMDLTRGPLISAFALLDSADAGGGIRFLAEPSTIGLAFPAGPNHPFFARIETVDCQCPNLTEFQCAKLFNLAIRFTLPDVPDGPAGESYELWPTETADFTAGDFEYRVVDVFSYTHREISPGCTGNFDWAADRMSYFVTRLDSAPAR